MRAKSVEQWRLDSRLGGFIRSVYNTRSNIVQRPTGL